MSVRLKSLTVKEVIERLQEYDDSFNLYKHKISHHHARWSFRKGADSDRQRIQAFPINAPKGFDTILDKSRLNRLIKHFGIPREILTNPQKRSRTLNNS